MKKLFLILLISLLLCFVLCGCQKPSVSLLDSQGDLFAEVTAGEPLKQDSFLSYTQIVLKEAIETLQSAKGIDKTAAEKEFYRGNYSVYTYLDLDALKQINEAYLSLGKEVAFGCAVTDLKGGLIAVYSAGNEAEDTTNFATAKTQPFSAFKPLSVYAPAIENGLINYSSSFFDTPYKQIEGPDGSKRDWPANADGKYLNHDVTLSYAVKRSLNTVAVKCLAKVGVNQSLQFLRKSFDLDLVDERTKASVYGEEEVIGNLAMGYLLDGVSPVDMAGYYAVFDGSGVYNAPKTIVKICDSSGNEIFQRNRMNIQAISLETAAIMNHLLSEVVSYGGTGEKANCGDIPVVGKTGTGDNNSGNWFVGLTPDYSCAIWHANVENNNLAPDYFSRVLQELKQTKEEFLLQGSVKKAIYCADSGMILGPKCKKAEVGYYTEGNFPAVCDIH